MRAARLVAMARGVLLVAIAMAPTEASAGPVSLCGRTAAFPSQLYLDVAKQIDASILRATEAETIIETPSSGVLWLFVVKPVDAVLCRRADAPATLDATCSGEPSACEAVIRKLTADIRAQP